ncbi:MAG: ABC transporter ATP-binding protein/permease [Defluviitaleaceae bacterium]|nr:ABC transporter ATP-binding protein/permease [Defluviitaleaceae bacterium]
MKVTKNSKSTVKRILGYIMSSYGSKFVFVLILILISSLAAVVAAMFLEILIENYILPLVGIPNPNFGPLITSLSILASIFFIGSLSNLLFNRIMITISQGVQKQIRDELFTHMQKLKIKYFDQNPHGDLMSRFSNDVDALRNLLGQSIPIVFSTLLSLVLTFSAMIYMSFFLTVVVIVMVTINLFFTVKLGKNSAKYFTQQQITIGKLNSHIEEIIGNQKVVKVFNHEKESIEKFNILNEEFRIASTEANKYSNMFMPLIVNMGFLQYVVIAIVGGFLAINGITSLTIGAIAAFLQLSRAFTMPLGNLSFQINSIIMAVAGATRIFEVMDEKIEEDNGIVTFTNKDGKLFWSDGESLTEAKGQIELKNVNFGYDDNKTILFDIEITATPGNKVAIVGATGAGKTTITNLINRFYDIQKGSILYDGIDITNIKKSALRQSLGIVLQDTFLFTDTIRENIRYGNLNATDDEVVSAAKLANAHDFIELLPNGYDTILTSAGAELSIGQRQLLSIARAAAGSPAVMILDEATSSIDTRTELIVQKGMDSLMHGNTVFVIAHRLSTIKNADVIVVMDLGRVIEKGNHRELMNKRGRYYDMYVGGLLEAVE